MGSGNTSAHLYPPVNSAQGERGRLAGTCVKIIGSINTPAIPLNTTLEKAMLPSSERVAEAMKELLNY